MVYFKIAVPNEEVKYIKDVNAAKEELTFTTNRSESHYTRDEGFFADSEFEFLMFHYKKKYPELEYMKQESSYSKDYGFGDLVADANPIGVGNLAEVALVEDAIAEAHA